jgi:PKD repeat protein
MFTDQSTDNVGVTGWSWKFGDGAVSNQQSPSHTYSVAGTYKVSLTSTDNGGETNSVTQTVVVPTVGTLSVTGSRTKGEYIAHITWRGFIGSNVNLYRNGTLLATLPNTGSYTDSGKVGPAVTYKICEIGSTACSQLVTADF